MNSIQSSTKYTNYYLLLNTEFKFDAVLNGFEIYAVSKGLIKIEVILGKIEVGAQNYFLSIIFNRTDKFLVLCLNGLRKKI